jgi:hypothetical protein
MLKLNEVDELVEMPKLNKGGMLAEMPKLDKGSKLARTPELIKGGKLAETPKLLWVFAFMAIVWVAPLPPRLQAMMFGIVAPIDLRGSWMTDILSGVIAIANANTNLTEVPVVVLVLAQGGGAMFTIRTGIHARVQFGGGLQTGRIA